MKEELKIRLEEPEKVERKLEEEGEQERKIDAKDTYFDTPGQNVLKIREDDEGSWLVRFRSIENGFQKTTEQKIEDKGELKNLLKQKHGVKSVLKKPMSFYSWKRLTAIINRIENIGDFLIIEGESPQKKFVEENLGLEDPEYITVAFSDLDRQN